MTKKEKITELDSKMDLYHDLIDAIVGLQDKGLGDSTLSSTQSYANGKIIELQNEISELE